MAYNSKAIKTDLNAKPISQYYNPATDEYEVLQGVGGAARQVLYGPDGNPISTADGKLAVKASELETLLTALKGKDFATETKLEAVRVLLNSLAGEDFATQTTLAQILAKMIASPATEAKQAELLVALGSQSTSAKQDALAALVGAIDAAAVTDPAAAGAVIALLKGVLSRLHTLEGKLDGITDGTTPAKTKTQLTGSLIADSEAIPVKNKAIETKYFFNAQEIRESGQTVGTVVDVSKYKSVTIIARSTLNVSVRLTLHVGVNAYYYKPDTQTWSTSAALPETAKIQGNSITYLLNSFFEPWLNSAIPGVSTLNMFVVCDTAPTAGSITVMLMGVPL